MAVCKACRLCFLIQVIILSQVLTGMDLQVRDKAACGRFVPHRQGAGGAPEFLTIAPSSSVRYYQTLGKVQAVQHIVAQTWPLNRDRLVRLSAWAHPRCGCRRCLT